MLYLSSIFYLNVHFHTKLGQFCICYVETGFSPNILWGTSSFVVIEALVQSNYCDCTVFYQMN
jgi:hypothetical protein